MATQNESHSGGCIKCSKDGKIVICRHHLTTSCNKPSTHILLMLHDPQTFSLANHKNCLQQKFIFSSAQMLPLIRYYTLLQYTERVRLVLKQWPIDGADHLPTSILVGMQYMKEIVDLVYLINEDHISKQNFITTTLQKQSNYVRCEEL